MTYMQNKVWETLSKGRRLAGMAEGDVDEGQDSSFSIVRVMSAFIQSQTSGMAIATAEKCHLLP
jgi:hypothetical protein